jgi:hypothetical protein
MALVRQAIEILGQAAVKTDPSNALGQALLKSIQNLAKHAPAGQAQAPGTVEPQALRNIAAQAKQQAPLQALMRNLGGGGQGGAPPSMPPGGGAMPPGGGAPGE